MPRRLGHEQIRFLSIIFATSGTLFFWRPQHLFQLGQKAGKMTWTKARNERSTLVKHHFPSTPLSPQRTLINLTLSWDNQMWNANPIEVPSIFDIHASIHPPNNLHKNQKRRFVFYRSIESPSTVWESLAPVYSLTWKNFSLRQ